MKEQAIVFSEFSSEQLRLFTLENLRAKEAGTFYPGWSLDQLRMKIGQRVMAVDIGGDKITAGILSFSRDDKFISANIQTQQGKRGEGYLAFLENLAEVVERDNLPIGISSAGIIEGSRLIDCSNISKLIFDLKAKYAGDLTNLFPNCQVVNDALAGITRGALEVVKQESERQHFIYLINGGGLGGAVLTSGHLWALEPGHIPVVSNLNPLGQHKPCQVGGAQFVCLENVAASGAGIEDLWFQKTGERLTGEKISEKFQEGDPLAVSLYRNSALIITHAIIGIENAFGFDFQDIVFICHGGCFKAPGYAEMVSQLLEIPPIYKPAIFFTKNFTENACLEGAAIVALIRE